MQSTVLNICLTLGCYLAARRRFTAFRNRATLASWQHAQLRTHLLRTARQSPFYRSYFAQSTSGPPAELASWPQTDKAFVTGHLAEWLTRPVDLTAARELSLQATRTRDFARSLPGDVTVGLSSGTTGAAAMFFVSARERTAWAGLALARVLRGSPLRSRQQIAFFLRANSPLYESVGSRTLRFTYFDLQRPVAESLEELERCAPTVIVAPPSVLRLLAEARGAGKLRSVAPRQIVSVAEVLDADDRAAVERTFGVRVDEGYQASEGFLAATCRAGALHWNEDILHVEREPLGDGRYHPVLTDFRRRLQPVIRYRLDDVITDEPHDAPPCACGSVFRRIQRVEGRQDDSLRLPRVDDAGDGPLFPDFVRLAVSACAKVGLDDFRVRQADGGTVEVCLRPEPPSPSERTEFLWRLEQALAVDCTRAGLRPPACRWMPWPDAADSDKRRRVVGPRAGKSSA